MTSEQARAELLLLMQEQRSRDHADARAVFPLDRAGLLLAADVFPELDPAVYEARLDGLAARTTQCAAGTPSTVEARSRLRSLRIVLFEEEGFHGNRADYYDPRNSYLHEVLDRKLGIPISLAAVVLGIARRLDWPLFPVNFPAHFLLGYRDEAETLAVDPFHGGLILGQEELEERWQATTHSRPPGRVQLLRPAEPVSVLLRMLRNLQITHAGREEFRLAARATDLMRIVDPENPVHERDLGALLLRAGDIDGGRAALNSYLRRVPHGPDAERLLEWLRDSAADDRT